QLLRRGATLPNSSVEDWVAVLLHCSRRSGATPRGLRRTFILPARLGKFASAGRVPFAISRNCSALRRHHIPLSVPRQGATGQPNRSEGRLVARTKGKEPGLFA